ncbi:MAG: GNAT family N-acetyltransferase [Chloroflexi bacterium]|nr:GNAT family N-acetyltransferase [Chloroflexota bacterium]
MIEIKRIEPHQTEQAKRIIITVADSIYHWDRTIDESIRHFEQRDFFKDIEDFQARYFDNGGLFLVVEDDGRMIGMGAVRKIDDDACELRRIWLLPEYHGRGIGYRVVQMLFDFARAAGYKTVRLETDNRQARAIKFYERLGFYRIAPFDETDHDVFMEMKL